MLLSMVVWQVKLVAGPRAVAEGLFAASDAAGSLHVEHGAASQPHRSRILRLVLLRVGVCILVSHWWLRER